MPEDIPDWVTSTPDECLYSLTMYESLGGSIQVVEMTRDEYVALKDHLATMRGHFSVTADEAIAMVNADPKLVQFQCEDTQQPARHLQTARDFYALAPHLVVFPSAQFDADLEKLATE